MLVSLTLGLPYLYFKVITVCKRFLDEIPVKGTQKEKWAVQAYFSMSRMSNNISVCVFKYLYLLFLMLRPQQLPFTLRRLWL